MGHNHEKFLEHFQPMLRLTKRWDGFSYLSLQLSRKSNALIVETGCVRRENDWEGAGCSTRVWDWMVEETEGATGAISIDNDSGHVELAKHLCRNVKVQLEDSIFALRRMVELGVAREIDLLFLDSYDHNPPYGPSELHAAGELACVWDHLKSGCFIAVDDCNPDGTGKHHLVRQFFIRMNIKPEKSDYIHIWRKP